MDWSSGLSVADSPPPRRLWIAAHYNHKGVVAPYFASALRTYRRLGGKLVTVTTATLNEGAREVLWALSDHVIERENIGLDFGSWRHALLAYDFASDYDEVIIVNDSVFGPFAPIDPFIQRLSLPDSPILGMTISREVADHIQSFFIGFNLKAFPRAVFERFWWDMQLLEDKNEIIQRYEIGLSRTALRAGVPLAALLDMRLSMRPYDISARFAQIMPNRFNWQIMQQLFTAQLSRRSNPMMYHWAEALNAGVPFLKVELMRDNPIEISLGPVRRALIGFGGNHADEVFSHLRSLHG
jgi:lipopolysaccharide biosynthesis protein